MTREETTEVREFEGIEVTYPPEDICTYPEYKGKPYFGIRYRENGESIVGYGTYNPQVLSRYLKDYFMPTTKNDIRYNRVENELNRVKDELEPTTKNCESCRYYGSHHEVCNYCYKCSLWTEKELTTKNDLGVDCISREQAKEAIRAKFKDLPSRVEINTILNELPSVTPQKPRKGKWLRMSDLSEQEDDRYECSRCGNVIHHKNEMNLYTFNSWCGRCGSDNGRKIEVTV